MVRLKLAFMEWFFYNLVIRIKLYKIRYLNLDKTLLFPRNQTIFAWKIEDFDKFQQQQNLIFVAEILPTFPT